MMRPLGPPAHAALISAELCPSSASSSLVGTYGGLKISTSMLPGRIASSKSMRTTCFAANQRRGQHSIKNADTTRLAMQP
eukprot:scaffold231077_cov30-Tisochrysis_lutea.AAC.2